MEGALCSAVWGCSPLQKNEGGFTRETSLLSSLSHPDPQTFQKLPKPPGKQSPEQQVGREKGAKKFTFQLLGEGRGEEESSDLGRGHSESEAPSGT